MLTDSSRDSPGGDERSSGSFIPVPGNQLLACCLAKALRASGGPAALAGRQPAPLDASFRAGLIFWTLVGRRCPKVRSSGTNCCRPTYFVVIIFSEEFILNLFKRTLEHDLFHKSAKLMEFDQHQSPTSLGNTQKSFFSRKTPNKNSSVDLFISTMWV